MTLFTGKIIRNCTEMEVYSEAMRLYLLSISSIGHTKPNPENVDIQVQIIVKDLFEKFSLLHLTELSHIFTEGIRHEFGEYTIFAPVEVYKWCKKWMESPQRHKARNEFFDKRPNRLKEAPQETTKQPDFVQWEIDAEKLHRANKRQFAGLHYLYEHLRSTGAIKWDWQEFREQGITRLKNQKLAGIGSKPLELADVIRNADKSEEGLIKYVCIEIAMEKYFNQKTQM